MVFLIHADFIQGIEWTFIARIHKLTTIMSGGGSQCLAHCGQLACRARPHGAQVERATPSSGGER
jgi:hypothetical protein